MFWYSNLERKEVRSKESGSRKERKVRKRKKEKRTMGEKGDRIHKWILGIS